MHTPATTILFGACDRHNLGDLLFPHIVASLLPDRPLRFAGLITRDMRPCGGHAVRAISELVRELGSTLVNLVHVGGEILTCAAWDAAVMLAEEGRAGRALGPHEREAESTHAFMARSVLLGTTARAPYVIPKQVFAQPAMFIYNAVGGATLGSSDPLLRGEIVAALRGADAVTVRDRRTQHSLAEHGVTAELLPDPGVMVAELFGDRIALHRESGEAAAICRQFPGGYLAVQFSGDFADDASLDILAAQLDQLAAATQLGVVFFRAGAAPMHDDPDLFRKVQTRMRGSPRTAVFQSLNIWDICSLIAASQGFIGSSLHGRIVALAYGLPRVTLSWNPHTPSKHLAFVEAWEDDAMPGVVPLADTASATLAALRVPPQLSARRARHLASVYRRGCAAWLRLLE